MKLMEFLDFLRRIPLAVEVNFVISLYLALAGFSVALDVEVIGRMFVDAPSWTMIMESVSAMYWLYIFVSTTYLGLGLFILLRNETARLVEILLNVIIFLVLIPFAVLKSTTVPALITMFLNVISTYLLTRFSVKSYCK